MASKASTNRPDTSVPLADGRIWGINAKIENWATDKNGFSDTTLCYELTPILLSSHTWRPFPLTTLLGFPLQGSGDTSGIPNPTAQEFDIIVDPESRHFGLPASRDATWFGNVLFTRVDGKDLDNNHLPLLMRYLDAHVYRAFNAVHMDQRAGKDSSRSRAITLKRLTPEAFQTYFEGFRRLQLATMDGQQDDEWKKTKSPVVGAESLVPTCGNCFSIVSNEGKALVKCAGCGERWYCNKHCQKHEWKDHKLWCGKAAEE